jgi:hypothetical protein
MIDAYWAVKKTKELEASGVNISQYRLTTGFFDVFFNGDLVKGQIHGYEDAIKYAIAYLDGMRHKEETRIVEAVKKAMADGRLGDKWA